jgi:hypothetical protein
VTANAIGRILRIIDFSFFWAVIESFFSQVNVVAKGASNSWGCVADLPGASGAALKHGKGTSTTPARKAILSGFRGHRCQR